MERTVIEFCTLEELEEATRRLGPGDSVRLKFVGSASLEEAATLYRALEGEVAFSEERWEVQEGSRAILRRAARHYDQLDALQSCLELGELDLKASVPMSKLWFDAVRAAANAICTSADDVSTALRLLDDVVIHSQRVGRLCRGLEFGGDDVKVPELTQDDLNWLMEDAAAALDLAGDDGGADGDGGGLLADVDNGQVLAYGDDGQVLKDANSFAVLAGLVDGGAEALSASVGVTNALADNGVLLSDVDDGKVLAYGDDGQVLEDANSFGVLAGLVDGDAEALSASVYVTDALSDSVDVAQALVGKKEGPLLADQALLVDPDVKEKHGDASAERGAWRVFKEETVVAMMRIKIRKLLEAIGAAKGRRVVNA